MKRKYPGDSLERLQACARSILKEIDAICREHDIDYIICAGTCLGAVRHQGFIPWDDDIDIAMPYDSWLKFVEIAPQVLPDGLSLHTPLNTPGFSTLWAKVYKDNTRYIASSIAQAGCEQGIFVDVFPYIQLDKDPDKAAKQREMCVMCQRMLYLHYIAHPLIPKTARFRKLKDMACALLHHTVAKLWTPKRVLDLIEPYLTCDNPSDQWINVGCAETITFDGSWLWPVQDMVFDDLIVKGPADPDAVLTCDYGDYMQLPPESECYCDLPYILDFGDGINVMEQ